MGPSVLMLVSNMIQEQKIVVDFGEEESKKENKKELDEKNTFFETLEIEGYTIIKNSKKGNYLYLVKKYMLAQEIVSPPPESFI